MNFYELLWTFPKVEDRRLHYRAWRWQAHSTENGWQWATHNGKWGRALRRSVYDYRKERTLMHSTRGM